LNGNAELPPENRLAIDGSALSHRWPKPLHQRLGAHAMTRPLDIRDVHMFRSSMQRATSCDDPQPAVRGVIAVRGTYAATVAFLLAWQLSTRSASQTRATAKRSLLRFTSRCSFAFTSIISAEILSKPTTVKITVERNSNCKSTRHGFARVVSGCMVVRVGSVRLSRSLIRSRSSGVAVENERRRRTECDRRSRARGSSSRERGRRVVESRRCDSRWTVRRATCAGRRRALCVRRGRARSLEAMGNGTRSRGDTGVDERDSDRAWVVAVRTRKRNSVPSAAQDGAESTGILGHVQGAFRHLDAVDVVHPIVRTHGSITPSP
jgi:hypothetical protein